MEAKSGAVWSATYARRQQPSSLGCRVVEESAASEWGRSGRGFSFPFACVSEHTRFAEATEMNRVR